MLQPVERRSLSDSAFDQLRDGIVSGQMAIGEALPSERVLCETLGVNRGALREALKRLQQARLVAIRQGGKTRVLDFRTHAGLGLLQSQLIDKDGQLRLKVARSIVEMRAALAPDMTRLAAARASAEQKAALQACLDAIAAAADTAALQRAALGFWDVIASACDNLAYRLAFNTLRETYEQLFELLAELLEPELTHLLGYQSIAGAIIAGDEAAAFEAAGAQLALGTTSLLAAIDGLMAMEAAR